MTAPTARVKRDGEIPEIPSREVVPSDILILKMGDKIPADARIIESVNLQTDEASLTRESLPVVKFSQEIEIENLIIGDRKNMVYAGTVATYGRSRAVVTSTGMKTEFGQIATQLSNIETTQTPLQKNIDHMGKTLSIISIFAISTLFVVGVLKNHDPVEMFIWTHPVHTKLNEPPRQAHKSIFSKPVIMLILLGGIWSAVLNLTIFYYFYYIKGVSLANAQGLVFINLISIQFVKAYNYRSDKYSIFNIRPFSNKWLNRAVIWEFILLLLIIYLPAAQSIMSTHELNLTEWIIIFASSLSVFPILEFGKWLIRRNNRLDKLDSSTSVFSDLDYF